MQDLLSTVLHGNEALFTSQELQLIRMLITEGQEHLFSNWPAPGSHDEDKRRLLAQVRLLDDKYPSGGLQQYIRNAKALLRESQLGINAFEGYTPSVPDGTKLDFASPQYLDMEAAGVQQAGRAAFVLVAGGLGERLGYSGIKLALPAESATGRCFLQLYIEHVLALQALAGNGTKLPFVIMTSDDTHALTQQLLEKNHYFGMDADQVTLLKQEKVACLTDTAAHLALDPADLYAIQTKPHGHGDVHALLHGSGLLPGWAKQGLQWVCFLQDTNALVFRALLVALGVSATSDYDMNSLAVPRKAKEAIGAIALLKHKDGSQLTVNVEYNQLDPLLRGTTHPEGDVNDETGFSPFPGNINQIVVKLSSYATQLQRTSGVISEFVNPKYADASRTAFKSSTRLECMMQDYPKALPPGPKWASTVINQVWATYSPVKNSPADARAKAADGNPTHSATTGEMDIYKSGSLLLQAVAGAQLPQPSRAVYNGIPVEEYPRVVLRPSFAPSLGEVKRKISPGGLQLAPRSVLVVEGADVHIEQLQVDGALVIRAAPGARVVVRGRSVVNAGWEWRALEEGGPPQEGGPSEEERMRGFTVIKKETTELIFNQPGDYVVSDQQESAADASSAAAVAASDEPAAAGVTPDLDRS